MSAWDNGGEPVEFEHDGDEYRVYGTVNAEGDVTIKNIELVNDCGMWSIAPNIPGAADALEKAWWAQLDWREQERLKNQEG